MNESDPLAPLEMVAETIFGEVKLDHVKGRTRRQWTRAVTRWYQLNAALIYELNSGYDFPACLSDDQYHSFRILREWWRAEYQPAEFSLAEILDIVDKCDEIVLENDEDDDVWYSVLGSLQLIIWPTEDIHCCETDEHPFYSWSMRWLFQLEFVWDTEDYRTGHLRRDQLRQYRHHGRLRAYCQQLKMAVFEKGADILDQEFRRSSGVSLITEDEGKDKCWATQQGGKLHRLLKPYDLSHGPPVNPCAWLPRTMSKRKEDMPYYLWDRDAGKTVETAELDDVVDYTAVSHTWGRWVKSGPPAQVAGVPWLVPQNQQFDVHDLANRLRSLDCQTRYLWFDLFCIPQDGRPLGQIEIARQATIFRTARRAVAWCKDVHDFEGLQAVLLYMLYQMVYMPPGSGERTYASWLAEGAWQAVAHKSTGLLEPREGPLRPLDIRPNVWFTSLWTLQEVCLRPDMWLCSSDWQTLSVLSNQPLSVMGILTIWRFYDLEQYACVEARSHNALGFDPFSYDSLKEPHYDQSHVAFIEFIMWTYMTNLNKLPEVTRVDIISMGDKRACTGRRGEAIMSAVGATAWFDPLAQEGGTEDLVLDKYPISFVEELKNAEPGTFFGHLVRFEDNASGAQGVDLSVALLPDNRPHHGRPVEYHSVWKNPKGSMLPFSQRGAAYANAVPFYTVDFVAHESVRTWQIQLDGSVHMPEACVLASSSTAMREDRTILPVIFIGFTSDRVPRSDGSVSDDQGADDEKVNLKAWIHSRSFEVHAVVVTHRVWTHVKPVSREEIVWAAFYGIVLARLDEVRLVKLGGFSGFVRDGVVPPATKHDWIVA